MTSGLDFALLAYWSVRQKLNPVNSVQLRRSVLVFTSVSAVSTWMARPTCTCITFSAAFSGSVTTQASSSSSRSRRRHPPGRRSRCRHYCHASDAETAAGGWAVDWVESRAPVPWTTSPARVAGVMGAIARRGSKLTSTPSERRQHPTRADSWPVTGSPGCTREEARSVPCSQAAAAAPGHRDDDEELGLSLIHISEPTRPY